MNSQLPPSLCKLNDLHEEYQYLSLTFISVLFQLIELHLILPQTYFTRHVNFGLHWNFRPSFHWDYPYLHRELIYYVCFLEKATNFTEGILSSDQPYNCWSDGGQTGDNFTCNSKCTISFYWFGIRKHKVSPLNISYLWFSLQILFSCSSLFSLAVISLERVHAVVWPLRHRTVNDRAYFGSIAFIWAAGICAAVSYILSVVQVLDPIFAGVPTSVTILSSLCVVCTSYVIIGRQLRRPFPVFDNQTRRDMEGNLKLSKTLFMVIGLSLICWIPAALLYAVHYVYQNCILQIVMLATTAWHLAISIVNPVVYSYRMPMLKKELKRCLNKCNFLQRTGNWGCMSAMWTWDFWYPTLAEEVCLKSYVSPRECD